MSRKQGAKLQRIGTWARRLWDEQHLVRHGLNPRSGWERFAHFWVLVGRSFTRNRCPLRAAALSYTTLLALVPLLAVPGLVGIGRRLPESRRFTANLPGATATATGRSQGALRRIEGRRLLLLATAAFLLLVFAAPASQFQNDFLREHRGYSATGITLFTLMTSTPAGIGIFVAGRLADTRGRRGVVHYTADGEETVFKPRKVLEVPDTTGAASMSLHRTPPLPTYSSTLTRLPRDRVVQSILMILMVPRAHPSPTPISLEILLSNLAEAYILSPEIS